MGELVVPFGLLERMLPTFDYDAHARALASVLDAGDVTAATSMWLAWRERADRVLTRKKVPPALREELLRQLSNAVRMHLLVHRKPSGSTATKASRKAKPSAAVIPFRARGSAA